MTTPNDGGPAYPVEGFPGDSFFKQVLPHSGMTMRQAYKLAALQGITGRKDTFRSDVVDAAAWCGEFADAMLAEDAEHAKKQEAKQ